MKLLILDADVIIHCHELGIWSQVLAQNEVFVPSYVLDNEANYFKDGSGKINISLQPQIEEGKLKVIEAQNSQFEAMYSKLKPQYRDVLDPGENEAVAIISDPAFEDYKFCSGDQTAIKAIAILSNSYQGVSLERVLNSSSIKVSSLKPHFNDKAFNLALGRGSIEKPLWLK